MSIVDPLDGTNPTYADKVKQLVDEVKAIKISVTTRLTGKVGAPVTGLALPALTGKALSTLTVGADENSLAWAVPNSFSLPPVVINSMIVYGATGALETRTFSAIGSTVPGNLTVTGTTTTVGLTSTGAVVVPAATLPMHAMQKQQVELLPGRLLNIQMFLTPGTFTYTKTSGTNKRVFLIQGGGGAGAGAVATGAGQTSLAGPGGAGFIHHVYSTYDWDGATLVVAAEAGVLVTGTNGANGQLSSITKGSYQYKSNGGYGGVSGAASSVFPRAESLSGVGGSGSSTPAPGDISLPPPVSLPSPADCVSLSTSVNSIPAGGSSAFGSRQRDRWGSQGFGGYGSIYGGGGYGCANIPSSSANAGGLGQFGFIAIYEYS